MGTTLPVLEVNLQPQQWIIAESGELSWMTASIGLFLAQLTGPGKVWLQSLPLPNLAHATSPYLPAAEVSGGASIRLG